jgi:hypothetical protein
MGQLRLYILQREHPHPTRRLCMHSSVSWQRAASESAPARHERPGGAGATGATAARSPRGAAPRRLRLALRPCSALQLGGAWASSRSGGEPRGGPPALAGGGHPMIIHARECVSAAVPCYFTDRGRRRLESRREPYGRSRRLFGNAPGPAPAPDRGGVAALSTRRSKCVPAPRWSR